MDTRRLALALMPLRSCFKDQQMAMVGPRIGSMYKGPERVILMIAAISGTILSLLSAIRDLMRALGNDTYYLMAVAIIYGYKSL